MCDDRPMHAGTDVTWSDAPIFSGDTRYGMRFIFAHAKPDFCEVWAQVFPILAEAGKAVWHTLSVQPGHEAGNALVASTEYADVVQQILFGRPYSGHFLEMGKGGRDFGKSLDSLVGLKSIFTVLSSFQGHQNWATNESGLFYLTVIAGDIIRVSGPISTLNGVRDLFIGFVVLLNFGGPQAAPSTLPSDPAWNHRKQGPFVTLSDTLFGMLLISLLPQDNYSIMLFNPGRNDLHDQRVETMAGHWLGGGVGMGLLAGLTGSFVAQFIAWAEDWKRFFVTGGWSALRMFGLYWLYFYLFRENATEGGTYHPLGGNFRGYPPRRTSPYLLPFADGTDQYAGQGNLGLFSHNRISNSPAGGAAVQQTYAYDFGHDFRVPIACSRAGRVWDLREFVPDSTNPGLWNFITILHADDMGNPDIHDDHDDFGQGPVQTYSVYGHLATNGVAQAPFFAALGGPILTDLTDGAGNGTFVPQGALLALAGDTGTSFHNHLHMHVLPHDAGTGAPSTRFAIPFVFRDAREGLIPGDGNLKSTTWYRSRNPQP
ncbi:MAG: hypothetical protein AAFX00_11340 [Pseudomonadota bacterium]